MFAEFFGGRNPFDTFFGQRNGEEGMDIDDPFSGFPMGMGGFTNMNFGRSRVAQEPARKKQDPPVTHDLRVSLEEIYSGCTKKMKISHKRLNPDGKSTRSEDKILTIEVKRGWKEGTKITFPKEGDQTSNNIPADIVFVLKDKPHNIFKRDGSDVVYPARISLREVRPQEGRCHVVQGGGQSLKRFSLCSTNVSEPVAHTRLCMLRWQVIWNRVLAAEARWLSTLHQTASRPQSNFHLMLSLCFPRLCAAVQ
jgi:DnaJ-class molecular chaperone